jgi:hypothetical protein
LRRECRCCGVPVVTAACFFCCRRAMGAASTRHSLRPLHPGGTRTMHHSGISCRGNAEARHCEERQRRRVRRSSTSEGGSNPDCTRGNTMVCLVASLLAMTTWLRCLICKSEPTRGTVTHVSGTFCCRRLGDRAATPAVARSARASPSSLSLRSASPDTLRPLAIARLRHA